ncbi:MAG: arginine--tRNA ligase [Anaerolineae bacterium]|nr:arginine--tRNA ligase [Anaerolineae bacterium]
MSLHPAQEIEALVREGIQRAQKAGELPPFEVPPLVVERPQKEEHGDYAATAGLQLAGAARMPPLRIAQAIAGHLADADFIAQVEVAPPGFLNFRLDERWLVKQVDEVLAAGHSFGGLPLGRGQRIQVEYVSANPTGPLHVGSGRNAAIGDSLANVLEAVGYDVQREYYVNDTGTQMRRFAETLYARYLQALGQDGQIPEDGYFGTYLVEMGDRLAAEDGDRFVQMPREEALDALQRLGVARMLDSIHDDLRLMGVEYDRWYSERSIYEGGLFDRVRGILDEQGYVAERDGAIWFTSTDLGDDKDNVLIRSDGEPGYMASDIAYHYDKFVLRGFDEVIDVWGADHQGHVPRMKAAMKAIGVDPERLIIVLYQLVTLRRGGEVVRLSKRTGDIITLREVLEEIGPDAVRFLLLARAADSQMDLDLDLAKEQSAENPVYYVQYAHARIASILRYAQDIDFSKGDVSLLGHPAELALIRQMLRLPEIVDKAATSLSPHYLPHYALELAGAFHPFYKQCRVVSSLPEDRPLNEARLKLVAAVKLALSRVLALMGVDAPESM